MIYESVILEKLERGLKSLALKSRSQVLLRRVLGGEMWCPENGRDFFRKYYPLHYHNRCSEFLAFGLAVVAWDTLRYCINGYRMNAIYIFSYVTLNSVKPFHSYGLHLCKVIGTKGRFYIEKSFNSHGNG